MCLCAMPAAAYGKAAGTIKYLPTGEQFGFTNFCQPEPRESVLANHNPTCDVRSYVGGLQVCKHMWSLLDAHQESDPRVQRWKSQPLTYYQKCKESDALAWAQHGHNMRTTCAPPPCHASVR